MLVDSLCCDKESADSICEEDCISISYITPTRDVAGWTPEGGGRYKPQHPEWEGYNRFILPLLGGSVVAGQQMTTLQWLPSY